MKRFPRLTTYRLLIDQLKTSDIPDIVSYAGNSKITDNTRTMPHPYYEEDAIAWINMSYQGFKRAKIVPAAIKAIIAVPNQPPITFNTPATLYTALSAPQALSANEVPMETIKVT